MTASRQPVQLSLFEGVQAAYARRPDMSNAQLYESLLQDGVLTASDLQEVTPVGQAQQPVNLVKRQIRWYQQTLRQVWVDCRTTGLCFLFQASQEDSRQQSTSSRHVSEG